MENGIFFILSLIIAKIERSRAIERKDELVDATEGVIVARGDLG